MKNLILFSLSILLISCEKNEAEQTENLLTQIDGLTFSQLEDLEGVYAAECQEMSQSQYGLGFLKFEKNSLGQIEFFQETGFSDSENCTSPLSQEKLRGSFKIDGSRKKIDITATEAALRPLQDEIAREMNVKVQCGMTNWRTNTYYSILNSKCIPSGNKVSYYVQSKADLDKIIVLWFCPNEATLSTRCSRLEYKKL